jgi:hypothetical protein
MYSKGVHREMPFPMFFIRQRCGEDFKVGTIRSRRRVMQSLRKFSLWKERLVVATDKGRCFTPLGDWSYEYAVAKGD